MELRGIGAVRDELDLMTGKVTERIGEVVLDGSDNEGWGVAQTYNDGIIYQKELSAKSKYGLCNNFLFNENLWWEGSGSGMQFNGSLTHIQVKQPLSFNDFISYLNANPLVIQYELPKESVKAIDLTSTYTFPPILNKNISIKGTITPTLGSITVPTEALSFTLNPNLEAGQQFIAPDFSISNDSQAPINLELKSFEQTTDVLNDVLPSKYTSWEGLNKEQSKDIALALEPQLSESWANLNEGSYYVVDTSNVELGQIKGNSAVDFKFSALHGQSFSEILNPQYKLTFVFEL